MGWIEWSEDRFELRVVWVDDDLGRVERESLPSARLEPVWAFRADQREHAAARSRPLEFTDYAGIGWNAGARYGQISPSVHNRKGIEETGADVGTWASADQNASQPGGRLYAHELSRARAQVHTEPAAACGHL